MDSNPGRAYRQLAAQGTTLLGLVVQSYDQILNAIYSAVRAIETNDVEKKTAELNQAFTLLSHLQSALDFEKGGEVARSLARFYDQQRARMLEASRKQSVQILNEVAEYFVSLREAWHQIEQSANSSAQADHSAAPPRSANTGPDATYSHPSLDWTA